MIPLSIAIDVDQVVADLHTEWFRLYNIDYNDTLTNDDIIEDQIDQFVKAECGIKIRDYLAMHTLYDNIKPINGALEGVQYLRNLGHRIVYASSCVVGTGDDKLNWLVKHGFTKINPEYKTCNEWVVASDKSWINADIMIDDRPKNIKAFKGVGVVFDAPYNKNCVADARMKSWKDIGKVLADLYPTFNEAIFA